MIVANQAKDFLINIHDQADAAMTATGTLKLILRLESDDAEDGYFWNHTTSAWVVAMPAFGDLPPLTYIEAALWLYALPAAGSLGKAGDSISGTATDDLDASLATIVSESIEHLVLSSLPDHAALIVEHDQTQTDIAALLAESGKTDMTVAVQDPATALKVEMLTEETPITVIIDQGD